MKKWIAAFRLKTLPLALGAIILGSWVNDFKTYLALLLQLCPNLEAKKNKNVGYRFSNSHIRKNPSL